MKTLAACITLCLFAGMPSAYAGIGDSALAAGTYALDHYQTEKAIRLFTMALSSNQLSKDDQVAALTFRGNAWGIENDHRHALADYQAAVRIEPDSATAHAYLGEEYALEENLDDASAEYGKALSLDPFNSWAYAGLCRVNFYQGKYDEALQHCDKSLSLDPDSTDAHLIRGNVLSAQGNYREAIKSFDKAILSDMGNVEAYYDRGFTLFYDGDFKQAAKDFARAQTGNRRNLYISIWRYMAQARAGNRHAAANLRNTVQQAVRIPGIKLMVREWPKDAILMFTGKMKPAEVMKTISGARYRQSVQMEYMCESSYFVGEWYMIHRQPAQAKGMFVKATHYCPMIHDHVFDGAREYDGAIAELTRMHASPAKRALE
jgi:tetratricopeptide (TPR) repeat protein